MSVSWQPGSETEDRHDILTANFGLVAITVYRDAHLPADHPTPYCFTFGQGGVQGGFASREDAQAGSLSVLRQRLTEIIELSEQARGDGQPRTPPEPPDIERRAL